MASTADLVPGSAPGLRARAAAALRLVTIEPILVCYMLSGLIALPALSVLELEKACRVNLALNDTVCDRIVGGLAHNFTEEVNQVQTVISNVHSWQAPLQTFMPLALILFIGSFSDRHKWRKPFFIIPLIGELFAVLGCILCVFYIREWPVEVQAVLQQVVPSFCGGQVMLVSACFSYIADVSSLEMRTLRVGAVQISLNVAIPIGNFLGGVLFAHIGYYGVLGIAAALFTFAILHGCFWVPEPAPKGLAKGGACALFADLFDPKHALETLNLLVRRVPGKNRLFIVLMFLIMMVFTIEAVGTSSLLFLYLNKVFNWSTVEYGYYTTTSTIVHLIGTSVGLALLSKVFKLNDFVILLITICDFIAANIVFALAKTPTMLYVSNVCSLLTGITVIGIRSLATKVVQETDFGKAQSLFGIGETLGGSIIGVPLYNTVIYVNTIGTFPNAFIFFGSILYACLIPLVVFMMLQTKKKTVKDEDKANRNNIKLEDQITHM